MGICWIYSSSYRTLHATLGQCTQASNSHSPSTQSPAATITPATAASAANSQADFAAATSSSCNCSKISHTSSCNQVPCCSSSYSSSATPPPIPPTCASAGGHIDCKPTPSKHKVK